MKEIIRNGFRFPLDDNDYQPPPELGEELKRLNQELLDAKNRPPSEVPSSTHRTGQDLS